MARRTTLARLPALGVMTLLAVSCTEPVGLERTRTAPPRLFAAQGATSIVLDQFDGTAGQSGVTRLVKGFNPTNPHVGDAIVATFFWTGTNQITAVTDHLTNSSFQLVGNTYHLVDLVSAGGMSMATYVATNVQNFPDAYSRPAQDSTLAVQADFASPLDDGGLLISAYTGVAPDLATAFGRLSSTSGSGTGTTTADPGAITVGAGALAYGMSVASLAGVQPPGGPFTSIGTTQSDSKLNSSGVYAVPASAGAVDPQWTWFYNSSGTWLATVFALNAPPTTGNLTVTTTTTGSSLPTSNYTATVDGATSQAVAPNGSATFTNLAAGSHSVALAGVPANCTVSGGLSQTVTVPAGGTATAPFTVSCVPPATHLVFLSQPPGLILLSAPFTLQVAAVDDQGNIVPSYTGTMTMAIANDASLFGDARLSGAVTVTAVNGVATFSGLSVDQTGIGYTLGTSAAGLAGATSSPFTVIL